MSSRLFQQIREKNGLAYTVYSSLSPFLDSGVFTVYAATSPSKVALCLRLIEEESKAVCEKLLSADDLRMAKESLKGTILLSADSVESRMTSLAMNELTFGRQIPLSETLATIDATTPEDLRRVARQMFKGDPIVTLLGPTPKKELRAKLRVQVPSRLPSGIRIG
jgi:predicted Zn-dependent peptidase